MSNKFWYSSDPDHGITIHHSMEEAKTASHEDMAYHRSCAEEDFWHEDMARLHWGEMIPHERATLISESVEDETEEWELKPMLDETARIVATELGLTCSNADLMTVLEVARKRHFKLLEERNSAEILLRDSRKKVKLKGVIQFLDHFANNEKTEASDVRKIQDVMAILRRSLNKQY